MRRNSHCLLIPPLYLKGKITPKNQLTISIRNKRKLRNQKGKVRQTPWGAIQNGGFENSTLAPWYGDGVLFRRGALVGNNFCVLSGGLERFIAQYTLPLDTRRSYRLLFYVRRLTTITAGRLFVSYSAATNYEVELPLETFRLGRWRPVIFTIPVPALGAQDPVIFIGLRNASASAAIGIDQVFLRPIIQIDPPRS